MVNYYHILGLSQTATQAEIKTAYRKLALRYHPDKNGGSSYAEERFKQISEAYRVLSNPRKKARHDWMLEYGVYQQAQAEAAWRAATVTHTNTTAQRPGAHQRRRARPRFNSRQNLLATAWAFGIFFLMALLVVSVSAWNAYQLEQQLIEQNEQARKVYVKAEQQYEEGNFGLSLHLLKSVMGNSAIAPRASELQNYIFKNLEEEGLRQYQAGNYARAAQLLQLLADNAQEYRPGALAHLVSSYEVLQDYEGAIRGYKSVIRLEPRTIEARNRLARIYAEYYKDFDTALQYYQQASELVTDQYESEYGKAYAITVNPETTPDSHYQLHCGLAQVYISQGMLHQAESALKWAIFLRPDEPIAYYLLGIRHREANEQAAACSAWKIAADKGSAEAAGMFTGHCQ